MSIATLTDKDLRLRDAVVHQLEWVRQSRRAGSGSPLAREPSP